MHTAVASSDPSPATQFSEGGGRARGSLEESAWRVGEFVASVAASALFVYLIWKRVPGHLDVRTDIVGYPTVTGFDPRRNVSGYYLVTIVFPIGALAVYALLHRLRGRVVRAQSTTAVSAPAVAPVAIEPAPIPGEVDSEWKLVVTSVVRAGLVALALGLELAVATRSEHTGVVLVEVLVTYCAMLAIAAAGLRRWAAARGWTLAAAFAALNALAIPLAVLGLYEVSQATRVTVTHGTVHHYGWLPLWLAIAISLAILGVVVRALRRASTEADVRRVERNAVMLVIGPVLVFLLVAVLPGSVRPVDFEDGQPLAGARLFLDGAFPYRDFVAIHGPLQDALVPSLGLRVLQDSYWGMVAGTTLLAIPIYWVSSYFLSAFLFRRNAFFLALTVLLLLAGTQVADGLMAEAYVRLFLLPVILLAFAGILKIPRRTLAYALVGVTFLQVYVTPEAALAVPGLVITLIVFDYYSRDLGKPWTENFRRSLLCAEASAVIVGVVGVVLVANRALAPTIDHFITFSGGHNLTGAFPIPDETAAITNARFLLPALVIGSFWFMIARIRGHRPIELGDWVMCPAAAFLALYYPKFLGRPDAPHFAYVFAMAVPLVYYVAYRGIDAFERLAARTSAGRSISRWTTPHLVTILIGAVLLLHATTVVADHVRQAPTRFAATASAEPTVRAAGYSILDAEPALRDIQSLVGTVTGRKDQLFDFTNAPGYFYFLAGYDSPTRYYHVSTAIRASTQRDLVKELREARPAVVAYEGGGSGLSSWDGIPNSVRHYDVSYYVLSHYRPIARVDGILLFARNDIDVPRDRLAALPIQGTLELDGLYQAASDCPWGLFANFSNQEPRDRSPRTGALPMRAVALPDGSERMIIDRPADATDYRWLEIVTDKKFAPDSFHLSANGDPATSISFATDSRSPRRYLVQVGACAQWWGYDTPTLVLDHGKRQGIRSVRLIA